MSLLQVLLLRTGLTRTGVAVPNALCTCHKPHRTYSQSSSHPPHTAACRHHVSDVLGAYGLGFSLALVFYLQLFSSPLSARAGILVEAERELQLLGRSIPSGGGAAGYLLGDPGAPEEEPEVQPSVL